MKDNEKAYSKIFLKIQVSQIFSAFSSFIIIIMTKQSKKKQIGHITPLPCRVYFVHQSQMKILTESIWT